MNIKDITQQVVTLSLECGAFIKKEAESFDYEDVELKGKNDLVSYVDKEAEKMMVEKLKKILPEAGFITEEGTEKESDTEYKWIIDPLDGTTNFIHGLPIYSTSIALTRDTEIVSGVVFDIGRDDCFHAYQGGGAYCNGKPIRVSKLPTLGDSLLATGFPYYDFDRMPEYQSILNELMQNAHGLRRLGSAAIDLVYVGLGRYEGYFEYNLNPWDIAAGALIVEEAGGTVTDFSGGDNYLFGREILAANTIHAEMLAIIKKHW
ncbi:myo-inositol-1(or 4)-monophosphatase [Reichenbachiella faecimaris]|uniref:Inositol-1-monophosphatase n=1 Tax=Reichenbachiella faecimaris TaxID=692418 RepID=A0A1W2GHN1_REIFA|nr:inositol monophosphatase family protein [Reichenbachiella faecimaris]SMD36165.1 myo-inositol-1(or 4)-monophosphatase [Reichenbachiella faecimaris]